MVVDGRELSWDEFSEMLMTFEGCPFKLDIRDPSEKPKVLEPERPLSAKGVGAMARHPVESSSDYITDR